jgi:hypothetical protein
MVNNELRHDWEPTGGLISFDEYSRDPAVPPTDISPVQFRTYFAQAMIKHAPQPNLSS